MKYLTILLLLLSASAFAQQDYPRDITLSWTNASTYEPVPPATVGEPIAPGDLASVRIECVRNNETTPVITATFPVTGVGLAQAETLVGVIDKPGEYTCVGYSILVDGTESVASAPATRKYTGKPKPPSGFGMQ